MMTKRNLVPSIVALVGFASASWAQEAQPQPEPSPQQEPQQQPMGTEECPEFLRGARLSVSEIEQGVQFKILAGQQGYVQPLRNMARELAKFVEEHERTDAPPEQKGAAAPLQAFPPVNVDVKNISNGVLVTVKAEKQANVKELRAQADTLEKVFRSSRCIEGGQPQTEPAAP